MRAVSVHYKVGRTADSGGSEPNWLRRNHLRDGPVLGISPALARTLQMKYWSVRTRFSRESLEFLRALLRDARVTIRPLFNDEW